jgi:predicted GNAT superfamily acetyltransferase
VITFKDLTTLDEFARVVELERAIWGPGYDDVVPVPILAVTVRRGGILIGAFADDCLVGFVYSLPALKGGRPSQWSHMLGVVDRHRNDGLGRRLKMLQRDRALAMGVDVIEWTYDPMQALNAHLNFARLGVEVGEYEENVYGESSSPLHRGNPTDRFVAEWWIRRAARAHDWEGAVAVNRLGEARACGIVNLACEAPKLTVVIPVGFTEMLARDPALALDWRLATRRIFSAYLRRGYRVVDFLLDRRAGQGTYLLIRVAS